MMGPSASGSLKGTPNSITSAPASIAASTISRVTSRLGSPAVIYATKPGLCWKWIGIGVRSNPLQIELAGDDAHILVAASGEVHHQYFMRRQRWGNADGLSHGMRAFERRQNSLCPRQLHHGVQCGVVVLRDVLSAP